MVNAAVRSLLAAVMSALPAKLLEALLIASAPAEVKSTAATVTLDVPFSFKTTVKSEALDRSHAVVARIKAELRSAKKAEQGALLDIARVAAPRVEYAENGTPNGAALDLEATLDARGAGRIGYVLWGIAAIFAALALFVATRGG